MPDASASPPGMRSIYDRMTKPTPDDLRVNDRIRNLSRTELDRIIVHFGMTMEHLAAQRDDLVVTRSQDIKSWTIRVELKPTVESPVQFGPDVVVHLTEEEK